MQNIKIHPSLLNYREQLDLRRGTFGREFIDEFKAQIKQGLTEGQESSLAMILTHVPKRKSFKPGHYLGLDLSGTNFRVIMLTINENQEFVSEPLIKVTRIPERLKAGEPGRPAKAEELCDFIVKEIKAALDSSGKFNQKHNIGFTFAFPTAMDGVASGRLIKWTKEWNIPDLVGKDPVEFLLHAIKRAGFENLKINVLVNDAVGALIVGYFEERTTIAGGILGTGANMAAWINDDAYNFESGNFDFGPLREKVQTEADVFLDQSSDNRGHQLLEKMVGGKYLGKNLRLMLKHFIQSDIIFKNQKEEALQIFNSADLLKGDDLTLISKDTGDLNKVKTFFKNLGLQDTELSDRRAVQVLSNAVICRSAQLSALIIVSILEYIQYNPKDHCKIAIDGSLFEHAPGYENAMYEIFKQFFGTESKNIDLSHIKDSSGIGAALTSAVIEAQ